MTPPDFRLDPQAFWKDPYPALADMRAEASICHVPQLNAAEFAADGSTGPSRMVKKGTWKYMYLEGVDTLLFDLASDPLELNNLSGNPAHAEIEIELSAIAMHEWNPEQLRTDIRQSQKRRLKIHQVTQDDPTYGIEVRKDDSERYIRNAGAADTKAKARLPYVEPAMPDISVKNSK